MCRQQNGSQFVSASVHYKWKQDKTQQDDSASNETAIHNAEVNRNQMVYSLVVTWARIIDESGGLVFLNLDENVYILALSLNPVLRRNYCFCYWSYSWNTKLLYLSDFSWSVWYQLHIAV